MEVPLSEYIDIRTGMMMYVPCYMKMVMSLIVLHGAKHFKFISFPDFRKDVAQKTMPLAVFYIIVVVSGLGSLALLTVPMFRCAA